MIATNRRRVTATKGLPYDAEIEYLESDGNQWIDTGILGNSPLECDVDFMLTGGGTAVIVGCSTGSTKMYIVERYSGKFQIGYNGSSTARAGTCNNDVKYSTYTVLKAGEQSLSVDGVTIITRTADNECISNMNITLFALSGSSFKMIGRIYKCKLKQNDVLVRDFIPVKKNNVGYMYDKVSGQLFGNDGSGSFVLGNEVNL